MFTQIPHAPDVATCSDCRDLRDVDGLDLRRFASVEHRLSYSILEPIPTTGMRRWITIHPEPDELLDALGTRGITPTVLA